MLNSVLKLDGTLIAVMSICVIAPILALCFRQEPRWDCTDKSVAMAAWVTTCDTGTFMNTANCTIEAQKIFCKPVCSK